MRVLSSTDAIGLVLLTIAFAVLTIIEDLPLTGRNLLARAFAWCGGWLCALLFIFAAALWRRRRPQPS